MSDAHPASVTEPPLDDRLDRTRELMLPRDLAALERLNRFIEETVQDAGWSAALVFPLQLCLEEAVSNVIRHGIVQTGVSEIRVLIGERDGRVVARVEDEGEAFDPTRHALPPSPSVHSLADIPVGGLGIHLMRQFASRVAYARVGGRNRLVLEFGGDEGQAAGQTA